MRRETLRRIGRALSTGGLSLIFDRPVVDLTQATDEALEAEMNRRLAASAAELDPDEFYQSWRPGAYGPSGGDDGEP